jgi:hypothetical protein
MSVRCIRHLRARLTRQQTFQEHSNWTCWLTGAKQVQFVRLYGLLLKAAPDTDISMTLTAASGAQFVFPVKPEFPTAGGSGIDAQDSIIHIHSI